MRQYLVRRILISIPVFFGITIIMFVLINSAPGDPLVAMINPEFQVEEKTLELLRKEYGLDKPMPVRYMIWLQEVFKGNLGRSFLTQQPVIREIGGRLPATLELMGVALGLAILIGVPLGILSALRQYTILDYIMTVSSFFWVSVPIFFLGLVLLYLFSLKLDLFPVSGIETPGEPFSILDNLWHLTLPALAVATTNVAQFLRYSRASMLEAIRQDYVTTARSKGLRESVVLIRHAFRNALIPVVTLVGLTTPHLFGGAVITETIFQWPGIGMLYVQAVKMRDYNLVMGISFFFALVILLANLFTDLAYAWIDPRIQYD